ncbi:MAG: single-stranded-DNA-specific exonuclease RecJ [Candidatus Pacebacteria bacterium]|nr:single-stranded-DNA-specific exonuclease RecJ [Candidatus Paceibacterota bacterium]
MQKRWIVNKKYPEKFAKEFPELSSIILQLLWDREIKDQTLVDEFFNPDYEQDIHDPFLMKDMDKAVQRISKALENDEKITIYGDYDVDGVTSSVVMVSALIELKSVISQIKKEEAKKFIDIYIPDRELEGYGLNEKAIKEIKKKKTDLVVTVDCGISSFESVEIVKRLGMDIIITDHHHVPDEVPEALAVINPKQEDCSYPFKELAGVGVAFKVAQALIGNLSDRNIDLPHPDPLPKGGGEKEPLSLNSRKLQPKKLKSYNLSIGFEKWLLDLVALGTVADCVNLIGENRTLVKYGLLVINKTKRIGIKKLIKASGTKIRENGNVKEAKMIDTTSISFMLAPRLNAAGRMDHANTSYELLNSEDEREAEELAGKLEKNNQNRQRITEKAMVETRQRIGKYKKLPKIIIESDPDWRIGIVGLVAGKLADEYSRPFLVLQEKENQSAGSGRSIPEFNLIEAIEKCKDILISFGGHSQAAGLKIENKNLKKFRKKIEGIAKKVLKEEDLIPSIEIDRKIDHEQINWQLIDEIEKFKPFGQGNKKPVFMAKKFEVHEVRAVGNDNAHLKLCFKTILKDKDVKYFPAIAFRLGKLAEEMPNEKPGLRWGDIVDVVFQLEVNEWNGNRELQMNVLDLKMSE